MDKKCTTCKLILNISNFQKQKNGKYGVTSTCKNCKKEYWQKNKQKFSEAAKKRYLENQIERKEKQKKYYEENKETIIKNYRKENKNSIEEYSKKYHSNPLVRERINNQRKNKYKTDLNYKLSCILRSRFLIAINKNYKKSSIFDILGISIEGFKKHISSLFMGNMSWDNYGLLWELDHINPISSFNLKEKDEQIKCFKYKNYQPLYITTNIALSEGCIDCIGNRNKSSKISW